MKYSVVCYKDTQLETFNPPMAIPQDQTSIIEGVRAATIKGKVDDAEHKKLFYLGTFDTATGLFECGNPVELLDLNSLLVKDA